MLRKKVYAGRKRETERNMVKGRQGEKEKEGGRKGGSRERERINRGEHRIKAH